MAQTFISYSHSDSESADNIAKVLEEFNIEYFRDIKNIEWGNSISTQVKDGLQKAKAIIVIISPGMLKSQWVAYEVGYASARGIQVLPYLTHSALELPGFMGDILYVKSVEEVKDFFSNWNPIKQIGADNHIHANQTSSQNKFDSVKQKMSELFAEMKQDLNSANHEFVREFVTLKHKEMVFNHSKRRFEYYEPEHESLINKVDILAEFGFVKLIKDDNHAKIYRMTEEFVEMLTQ